MISEGLDLRGVKSSVYFPLIVLIGLAFQKHRLRTPLSLCRPICDVDIVAVVNGDTPTAALQLCVLACDVLDRWYVTVRSCRVRCDGIAGIADIDFCTGVHGERTRTLQFCARAGDILRRCDHTELPAGNTSTDALGLPHWFAS